MYQKESIYYVVRILTKAVAVVEGIVLNGISDWDEVKYKNLDEAKQAAFELFKEMNNWKEAYNNKDIRHCDIVIYECWDYGTVDVDMFPKYFMMCASWPLKENKSVFVNDENCL